MQPDSPQGLLTALGHGQPVMNDERESAQTLRLGKTSIGTRANKIEDLARGAFLLVDALQRSFEHAVPADPPTLTRPVAAHSRCKKNPSTWWQIDGLEEAPTSATNKKMDGALRMKQRLSWGFTGFLTR